MSVTVIPTLNWVKNSLLVILMTSPILSPAQSFEYQCLGNKCEVPRDYGRKKMRPVACEPPNDGTNVASLAKIYISPENATCGSPAKLFCSLKNRYSCMTCDRSRDDRRHNPSHMIDGIKWTWWQTNPNSNLGSNFYQVNVSLDLPKVFILTDDITIDFHDGRPEVMVVEKSADHGVTWFPLQYFADDCLKTFNIPKTDIDQVFTSVDNALSPICVEDFSLNSRKDDNSGVTPIFVNKRLNAINLFSSDRGSVCTEIYNASSPLKSFLEITNLRVRLFKPPAILVASKTEKPVLRYSGHYGIKKINISARCQCNGHASQCIYSGATARCHCKHNTEGSECQRCRPLFWMFPWKPGAFSRDVTSEKANVCVSFYSSWYREIIKKDIVSFNTSSDPWFCSCNNHSERCEKTIAFDKLVCVDCRHNTVGLECESCKGGYYRNRAVSISSKNTCLACSCDVTGSRKRWCAPSGNCACRDHFVGRKCDKCEDNFFLSNGACMDFATICGKSYTKYCDDIKTDGKNTPVCFNTTAGWCSCSKENNFKCPFTPTDGDLISIPLTRKDGGPNNAGQFISSKNNLFYILFIYIILIELCVIDF